MEFTTRFMEEWRARTLQLKVAFLAMILVALAHLVSGAGMSWKYYGNAGPAGVLCGTTFYLMVIAAVYMAFRLWSGDHLGWYGSLAVVCVGVTLSTSAVIEGDILATGHVVVDILAIVALFWARKQFWRHAIVLY
jgi:hypothetical protein